MAKKESYEDMLEKLKDIIDSLQDDECKLEESMKKYEQGVTLVNKLYKTLEGLEGKILVIKEDKEEEFIGKDEN